MLRGMDLADIRIGTGWQEVKRGGRDSEPGFGPIVFSVNGGCPPGGQQTGGEVVLGLSREDRAEEAVSKIIS